VNMVPLSKLAHAQRAHALRLLSMTWLLTGGAGYIGAHIVRALQDIDRKVVVIDDLTGGFRENVPNDVPIVECNVLDQNQVERAIEKHGVVGVIHLAAKKAVGESVAKPLWYYEQNVIATHHLLSAMEKLGVRKMVFSSSAAVYGEVGVASINEEIPTAPTNPYGETKLIDEWMIKDQAVAGQLSYINLRYFNVAGAGAPELGDRGVNNLIPMVFRALTNGENPKVFGADYNTRDGSCVRDYIHVADLARAHASAVEHLDAHASTGDVFREYNVGTGTGTTVLEIMDAVQHATGIKFEPDIVDRRPGDPPMLIASADRITRELGWKAERNVNDMVQSAWESWQHLRN
jgi:UDP-glucose 4-epimerase